VCLLAQNTQLHLTFGARARHSGLCHFGGNNMCMTINVTLNARLEWHSQENVCKDDQCPGFLPGPHLPSRCKRNGKSLLVGLGLGFGVSIHSIAITTNTNTTNATYHRGSGAQNPGFKSSSLPLGCRAVRPRTRRELDAPRTLQLAGPCTELNTLLVSPFIPPQTL
jgi:hypothetical protein